LRQAPQPEAIALSALCRRCCGCGQRLYKRRNRRVEMTALDSAALNALNRLN
jgi:hypothetical protein